MACIFSANFVVLINGAPLPIFQLLQGSSLGLSYFTFHISIVGRSSHRTHRESQNEWQVNGC